LNLHPGNSYLSQYDNDISNFILNKIIRRNYDIFFHDNTYYINHDTDLNNINNNNQYNQYYDNKSNNMKNIRQ